MWVKKGVALTQFHIHSSEGFWKWLFHNGNKSFRLGKTTNKNTGILCISMSSFQTGWVEDLMAQSFVFSPTQYKAM